ncbi:MAG: tryptophan 7-halogenase [Myxococcota bacterium]
MDDGRAKLGSHAVVLGASMAGLLAARALADSFERVTVLERDALADDAAPRKGVPQGRHVHNLLARGDALLDVMFPGLLDDLADAGAVRLDWSKDVRWHHHGVWKGRFETGVCSYLMSRPLLEATVRRHLQRRSNVTIKDGCAVEGLRTTSGRVDGVELRDAPTLACDFVVDCSGRRSVLARWLRDHGSEPTASEIHADVVYATRVMRRPPGEPTFKVLAQVPPPPDKRAAVSFAIEDGQWMVTLFGYHGHHPGGDEDSWLAHARGLAQPDTLALIEAAEPLSEITTFKYPFSLRRHWGRHRACPAGVVALGDSVCSFNPIYGQGMTSAALQVETLRSALSECGSLAALDERLDGLRRGLDRVVEGPWQAVASEDFRHAETTGDRSRAAGIINWYTRRLHRMTASDARVAARFLAVMHMQREVTSLFDPRTVLAVAMGRGA